MIKKKKLSLSIGLLSIALAFLWIVIVIFGIFSENEKIRIKELSGQKITYLLTGLKDEALTKDKKYIALVIEDKNGDMKLSGVIDSLPAGVTLGISPYNESMHKNIGLLKENNRSFLVNIPLVEKKDKAKKFDLYSELNVKEISNKIENVHNMTEGSVGFYSHGNDKFLDKEKALEATVKKIYDLELIFLYGVKNKTSILESQEGSSFKIKAFDLELVDDNLNGGLEVLEKIALEQGKAVGIVNFNTNNLKTIHDWYGTLEAKNIEIIDANSLFSRGS